MSGSVSLTNTETQAVTLLRAFLLLILPSGIEIIRAEVNRVSEPLGPDFVLITPISRVRLSTNVVTYSDGYPTAPGTRAAVQPTQATFQIDVHGPNSADNSQIISTLLRDEYAAIYFAQSGVGIMPLYAGEPRQVPFDNGENQTEWRWTLDAVLQINTTVTTSQDFAATVTVGINNVDATYPPQ
jgi:hypothetical protein